MIKASIIGCGKIAGGLSVYDKTTHAGAYKYNKDITIVSCYDVNSKNSSRLSKRFGCKKTKSIREIFDDKPDVISICTPDSSHFIITKEIIRYSSSVKVIFLEKPSLSNEKQFNKISSLLKKTNISIVVNHTRRFDLNHNKIRKQILEKKFGQFINGNATYYSGWMHNGIHLIDTLYFLLGKIPRVKKIISLQNSTYKNDPSIELDLILENNSKMIKINFFDEKKYQIFEFDLRFENARIRIENFGSKFIIEKKCKNKLGENILKKEKVYSKDTSLNSMQNAVNIITTFIKEKKLSTIKGYRLEDTKKVMKVMWSIKGKKLN